MNIKKSGDKCKKSGQYKVNGTKREITMVSGKPFPPTRDKGKTKFTLVDPTKHKK